MLSSMTRHKEAVSYVLIQHLSPDKKSYMQDILQDRVPLDVVVIEEGMTPKPNTFYLSPPGSTVRLLNDRFLLEPIPAEHSPNRAIDKFFTSLAMNSADKAVGVILSGSGNDGSEGCQAIIATGAGCSCRSRKKLSSKACRGPCSAREDTIALHRRTN